MELKGIFDNTAWQTEVTARVLGFDADDKPTHEDTILTKDNIDSFCGYSIMCIVPTGKYKLMIELA